MSTETKLCRKCGKEKPLSDFSRRAKNKTDGRQAHCKACHKEAGALPG